MRFAITVFVILLLVACTYAPPPACPSVSNPQPVCPTSLPVVVTRIVTPPAAALPPTSIAIQSANSAGEMWVCVELAVGYSAPSADATPVFQMSQNDGWKIKVLDKTPSWYVVRAGDMLAFMEAGALCASQPPTPVATVTATIAPTETAAPTATNTAVPAPLPTTRVPPTPLPPPTPKVVASGCPQGCIAPPPGCLIKGNVSFDSGEKIYHVPGGQYYQATAIDPRYGERWFCTETEAVANGWRKSSK